jgi:hypothetical protein
MAAFATMAAAEARAKTKMADGTWIVAHSGVTVNGTICVRVQRKMSPSAPGNGGWVELTDDAAV